jgi:ABC-type histidine transport system ATPase subunit
VTLSVSDIHKSFGSLDVLKGITIQAQQGDVISILGASGSGKPMPASVVFHFNRLPADADHSGIGRFQQVNAAQQLAGIGWRRIPGR